MVTILQRVVSPSNAASSQDVIVRVAADHNGIVLGCPGEDTTVTDVVLDVADDGTLRDPMEW